MGVGHNRTGRIDTEMELKFKFKLIVCETGRSTDVEEVLHRAMGRVDTRVEAAVGCRGRVPSPVCRAAMKSKPSNSLYTRGADRLRERAHYGHAHSSARSAEAHGRRQQQAAAIGHRQGLL